MSDLELRGISKTFGDTTAVDDLSLSIEPGELVSILGPSGCGKTTTLRLIAGFERPDTGRILIGGQDLTNVPPQRRNIGVVFQSYALFPHMTVAENVAFGLEMRGVARADVHSAVAGVLALVRLGELAGRYPNQLSGGQQQRVALARALAIRPRVLLLDEPLSNLDAKLRDDMREEIRFIQREVGITAVFVTHDQSEAFALADRVAVMDRGRLQQIADPVSIYEKPANATVGSFIGQANVWIGTTLAVNADQVRVKLAGGADILATGAGLTPGQACKVFIKHERIALTRAQPAHADNWFVGRVTGRTYLGHSTSYAVAVAGDLSLKGTVPNRFGFEHFDMGDEVGRRLGGGSDPGLLRMSAPQRVDLLIAGGPLLAMDAARSYWPAGAVAVRGDTIVDLGPDEAVRGRCAATRLIDAGGKAILPGFVSCHGHAGMCLLRGLAEDYPLDRWLRATVWPLMRHAGADEVHAGARLACLEMARSGITSFADMWRDLDATVAAVKESGLRARLAFNMRDFGDPAALEREWEDGLAALAKPTGTEPIRFGLSPHSLYACSDELLRRAGDALARTGCHLQIHLAETKQEVAELHARTGARPVERLEQFGLLSPNAVIAHGVWLDDDDCRRLAQAGASIAHNISSNMKLASGVAPLTRFAMAGLNVGLGTDSSASNNVLDPFREMRLATLMQRALARDPAAWPAYAALEAATRHGAAALGFGDETGSLERGKRADIVLIDLDKPHLGPRVRTDREALANLLVFAATADDVDTVIVDGHIIMEGRVPLTLDPPQVIEAARAAVRRLLARHERATTRG